MDNDCTTVCEALMDRLVVLGFPINKENEDHTDVLQALAQVNLIKVSEEVSWLDDDADISLRSEEGGRAVVWTKTTPALAYVYDPARAGHEVVMTDAARAQALGDSLREDGWYDWPEPNENEEPAGLN